MRFFNDQNEKRVFSNPAGTFEIVSFDIDVLFCFELLRTVLKCINGTEKRTRTSTGLPPLAPEASVSTNSTTSA